MSRTAGFAIVAAVALGLAAYELTLRADAPGKACPATKPAACSKPASRPASCPASAPAAPLAVTVKDIAGKDVSLAGKYAGKVVLVVNVASRCGYTKQYKGLQELHARYAAGGLAVLGFPCNQFGGQEPGTNQEIVTFCQTKYNVTFDLFSKIDVNGPAASPLYAYLTGPDAPVADKGPVKWNFEKFLLGRDGKLIARYRSGVKPDQIAKDIEAALAR